MKISSLSLCDLYYYYDPWNLLCELCRIAGETTAVVVEEKRLNDADVF
jgi:hypothetical protein